MRRLLLPACIVMLFLTQVSLRAAAQEESLTFRLNRDWGYGGVGQIQGRFSYRVSGPETLSNVTFLLNGEIIGQDDEAPFAFQFHTDDFPAGIYRLSVTGVTTDGQELRSLEITRQFLSAAEANKITRQFVLWFGGGALGVVLLIGLASMWASRTHASSKTASVKSIWGTAVCPKCGQPFGMHIWKLNLGVYALDRCPHCGKWSRVNRATDAEVEAALQAVNTPNGPTIEPALSPEEQLRKKLEDSRFND